MVEALLARASKVIFSPSSNSSAFSEMSQDAISHNIYRWKQLEGKPDTWVRATYGSELFYSRFAAMSDGAGDVIVGNLTSSSAPNFEPSSLKSRLYDAWIATRYELPLIAGKVEYGILPNHPSHLGCFVYEVVKEEEKLQEWARKTLFVTEVEDSKEFPAAVEKKRWELSSKSSDDAHPTTMQVVLTLNPDSEGKHHHGFFINAPHHIADASACLTLGTMYVGYLGKPSLPSRVWGTEIENLPPTSSDCLKMEHPLNDQEIALSCLRPILEGHKSLALKPQKPSITGPLGATERHLRVLSKELSSDIYKALKTRGFTVSHGVDAARQAACWSLRNMDAKREGVKLEEGYITNLLLPIDCTRQFAEPWKSKPYFCSGTAAFTTEVDLKALESTEDPTSLEGQLNAFDILLPLVSEQWKGVDPKKNIQGIEAIISMIGVDKVDISHLKPSGDLDAYTSLGILERLLPRYFDSKGDITKDESECSVQVLDWFASPRMTSSQVCLHTYSWYDRIHLLATYTNNYTREFVDSYLGLIEKILTEVEVEDSARAKLGRLVKANQAKRGQRSSSEESS